MNNSSLQNPYVIKEYINGDSWCRVYSDYWCEQGGTLTATNIPVTYLEEFKDLTYDIQATSANSSSVPSTDCYLIVRDPTTTGFSTIQGRTFPVKWSAKGYIKG